MARIFSTRYVDSAAVKPYVTVTFMRPAFDESHTQEDVAQALAAVEQTLRAQWGVPVEPPRRVKKGPLVLMPEPATSDDPLRGVLDD